MLTDDMVLMAIDGGCNHFMQLCVRFRTETGNHFRVVDRCLQRLRKAGVIFYEPKSGWRRRP